MTLTGDPRRWANEPGLVGVVRYPDTHRWGEAEPRPVAESLQGLEDVIRYEGAAHDRGGLPRDDRRDERHPHPARRLHPGRPRDLRPARDPDGRRRGHGRLRADRHAGSPIDHWDTVPDLMTMAKGLTRVVPAARRGRDAPRPSPRQFETKMFYGGLTYSSHPVSLAAALATIGVYEEDGLIDNAARLGRGHARAPPAARGQAPERRGEPQPRPVRDHRPRPEPRPVDPADARSTAPRTR